MSSGKVVQVIGAVVDVEFPRDSVPQVYDALTISEKGLTLEVQQQLGDGVVRAIAMGSSEGVSRGLAVDNTGAPISAPVGTDSVILGGRCCVVQSRDSRSYVSSCAFDNGDGRCRISCIHAVHQ